MLKTPLIHPEILAALGGAGHESRILIADGNFPHSTARGRNSQIVYANFAPDVVGAPTLLKLICQVVPIETASVMQYLTTGPHARSEDPPIWAVYREILREHAGLTEDFERIDKFDFYKAAARDDVCLTIATGETRIWANLLLKIGVVT